MDKTKRNLEVQNLEKMDQEIRDLQFIQMEYEEKDGQTFRKNHADVSKQIQTKEEPKKKKRKATQKYKIAFIVMLILFIGSTLTAGFFFFLFYRAEPLWAETLETTPETVETQEGVMQETVESRVAEAYEDGKRAGADENEQILKDAFRQTTVECGIVQALRDLYPEYIVFYDTEGYAFHPIEESIGLNGIDKKGIVFDERGFADYIQNDIVVSKRGIDVSKYNGSIDWEKVAADQIDFVFARVGFRGYGSGAIAEDEKFAEYVNGASAAGLNVGAYFFTEAISIEEAEEEAAYVLDKVKDLPITYPIVLDVEKVNVSSARAENLTMEQRTQVAIAFCEKIKEAGYTPMIYGNIKCFMTMLDLSQLKEYDKWFAFYDKYLYYPYEVSTWQYTESGSVDGIDGAVDVNVMFKDYSAQ